ncbi:MAG: CPBP family intramembrane metalloprotease [Anaerolineae bacterium]|nr:CPBP family intramembrane metalloprotease [Anaerolineae bacterium]
MTTKDFQLAEQPWLALLIVMAAIPIMQVFVGVVVIGLFKQPRDAPMTQFIVATLAHILVLFVLVPFVLGLPAGKRSFTAYMDAIRLNRVRPFRRLLLLGLSCYLILALCQASGVLVYRILEGKAVTWPFVRGILDLSGDLPPKSWNLLVAFPTIFEEVAFRGVLLSLFLAHYPKSTAVIVTALSFGAIHILNLGAGLEPAWVLGQAVWAAILGGFYGVLVLKSGSLWPAMVVHYLSNLFVGSLTAYLQASASIQTQAIYGVIFSFGLVPTTLMILWVLLFTKVWPLVKN